MGDNTDKWVIPETSPIAKHRFIFVCGLHRSGTTPVFTLLRDHPMVSGFRFADGAEREHEGQFHQSVYPLAEKGQGAGYFALIDEACYDENNALATPANALKLFKEWSRHWDLSKLYLLEKTPRNLVRTRFLQRLFPGSYFIVIVRHPVAVSLATLKWMGWPRYYLAPAEGSTSAYTVRPATREDNQSFHESRQLYMESMLYTLFQHWMVGHRRFADDSSMLSKHLIVRYEDLVGRPDPVVRSIYRFLDLDPFVSEHRNALEDHNGRYFDEWRSFSTDVLSLPGRQYLIDTFSEPFSRFGYSLTDVKHIGRFPARESH